MTDTTKLAALDAKATPGVWNHLGYCGQDGVIQGARQEVVTSFSIGLGTSDQTGHQCFANAAFIVTLVNAYRANALVPRAELEEAVGLLHRLANAYEGLCCDTGKNYHQSPGSYYAHVRAFLARQEANKSPLI